MDLLDRYDKEVLWDLNPSVISGLVKTPWEFSRGAKEKKIFKAVDGSDRITVSYTNKIEDGGRIITPELKTYQWFNPDGSAIIFRNEEGVEVDKKVIPLVYSGKKLKDVYRHIRQGQLDYLEDAAEHLKVQADSMPTPISQADLDAMSFQLPVWVTTPQNFELLKQGMLTVYANIKKMYLHYDVEVKNYVQYGWRDFELALLSETDPFILDTLSRTARNPDVKFPNGLTVRESIMYQLIGAIA